ncbi:hypothetical protein OE88DRAFT_1657218 [Heliocybe sulcata]|uniref:Uncharacterized protein n=1 Tax=Heliocybe sulcata TaxID=5364 RepID=A0A5C3N4F5_9AGAM|nr:hypothetical protein OE88DRAFT_1657218 [Heliocybe sulcata]
MLGTRLLAIFLAVFAGVAFAAPSPQTAICFAARARLGTPNLVLALSATSVRAMHQCPKQDLITGVCLCDRNCSQEA